jgi:hypothetical protein
MDEIRSPLFPFLGILAGHLLIVLVGVFWSVYWARDFATEASGAPPPSGLLVLAALVCGFGAFIVIPVSIPALPLGAVSMPFPLSSIPLWGTAFFVLWFLASTLLFRRPVTSELLLIPLWALLEAVALYALASSGWLGGRQTALLAALTAVALLAGLVCYILHYRLGEHGRYVNGLVPYGFIGAVSLAVVVLLAFNRAFRTGMIR